MAQLRSGKPAHKASRNKSPMAGDKASTKTSHKAAAWASKKSANSASDLSLRTTGEKPTPAAKRPSRPRWLWRLVTFIALAGFLTLLITQAPYFIQILALRDGKPTTSRFMEREAQRLAQAGRPDRLQHRWVPYGEIADSLKRAVVIAEDARFVEHHGVDWNAIRRAWLTNLARDEIAFGGSTITMQLAKNLFLTGERSYLRKVQEMLIAAMLELALDKPRIFELYLNLAQLGDGLFGAQAAARHYYQLDAHELAPSQAARLAAMLPRPAWFDRNSDSEWLAQRTQSIAAIADLARIPICETSSSACR